MKIVFHKNFLQKYTHDPAASVGRLDHALRAVEKYHTIITPEPCSDKDVLLVHSLHHLNDVKSEGHVYQMALLAAGATIKSAELAMNGEYAFALCRPPGHHASPGSCWGFCYFNNVAIALKKLLSAGKINKVLIIDFDLHFGDGTNNTFSDDPRVNFWHVNGDRPSSFIANLDQYLRTATADIVAVSAGFDRHQLDWGRMLSTEDYRTIGTLLGSFARLNCQGRLFAALEGGYNHISLGDSLLAFLDGLENAPPCQGDGVIDNLLQ
ncbi:MAG TPA: hypothetical protein VLH18_08230 [Candidatus Limnocylindrales bacterium]|nr:hypothetical protein [Candidatus Limnocylindrales bacterium]